MEPTNQPLQSQAVETLLSIIEKQQTIIAEQAAIIEKQREEIATLTVRAAELERRLGLNSSNSSKPPSSDGLKKPPRTESLREKTGRKSGGQKGHKGHTLAQVEKPDQVINHYPVTCSNCGGAPDAAASASYQKRQVIDVPKPQPLVVIEHRAHACGCPHCGAQTQAAFPEGINAPVQYGPRIAALAIYLQTYHFIPEDRLAELLKDLYEIDISTATIAAMEHRKAEELAPVAETIGEKVKQAPVKHLDETGYRIGGRTQWLHVATTLLMTFYHTSAKRGALLADVIGVAVHDHWKPYFTMQGVLHALCNAHHLRELKALMDIEKEGWAFEMYHFLRRACHAVNAAKEQGHTLTPELIAWLQKRYARIVAKGLAFHEAQPPPAQKTQSNGKKSRGRQRRRTGHNLLLRLQGRRDDVLRFLIDFSVPFTNNLAEQALRMMKVRLKISGCFRTVGGAEDFITLRTVLHTARKQGWSLLETLQESPDALIRKLRAA
jgi:transposase